MIKSHLDQVESCYIILNNILHDDLVAKPENRLSSAEISAIYASCQLLLNIVYVAKKQSLS